jgi:HSP20 family protein
MKITYPLATLAAFTSGADANIFAFQHGGGCAPCAAANANHPSTSLDMRRRRSPMMRSLMTPPSPRSVFDEIEQMNELMERQFNQFFETPMMLRPTSPSPFLSPRRARAALMLPDRAAAAYRRPTYRYRIDEDEAKYTLSVELPGVKASDVNVSLEQDGRVLRISGMRKVEDGDMAYESKFSKDFVLNKDVHVEGIEAKLSEGFMSIVAPKKPKVEPKSISIPIHEEVPTIADQAVPEEEETKKVDTTGEEKVDVEMKTEAEPTPDAEVVDLDEKPAEENRSEVTKADATPDEGESQPPKDDLLEDGDILI